MVTCMKRYGLSLQEIKASLRQKYCRSYILAHQTEKGDGHPKEPNTLVKKKYQIFVSTHQKEVLLEEFLAESLN